MTSNRGRQQSPCLSHVLLITMYIHSFVRRILCMASLGRLLDMRVHGRGPVGLDLVEQGMGHELVVALCQVTWLPECFSKGIRILTQL